MIRKLLETFKQELLDHYAESVPRGFYQWDGWRTNPIDAPSGACCTPKITFELMRGADVRVLVPLTASQADTVRLLRMIAKGIERNGLAIESDRKQVAEAKLTEQTIDLCRDTTQTTVEF